MTNNSGERILTVTVTEHSWTTYRIPAGPALDAEDYAALEDLIVNGDPDEREIVESAVEHREITVDNDATTPPAQAQPRDDDDEICGDPFDEECRGSRAFQ